MIPTFGRSMNRCQQIINEYLLLAHLQPHVYCFAANLSEDERKDATGSSFGRKSALLAAIGVTRVKIGDRIAGCLHPRWFGGPIKPDYLTDRLGANLDGMMAEYAVLSEEALVHLPSHLSFGEAATLPCAAVTAWVALTGHRRVTAGDTVLTQGSGGVSVFALQLARVLGARVIAATSTAEKAERLKALGASDVINYAETPDWDEKARELTDGHGVDSVVEIGQAPGSELSHSVPCSQTPTTTTRITTPTPTTRPQHLDLTDGEAAALIKELADITGNGSHRASRP
jgi:NADPH:quinone reductase-like Zn-dependent oxidoreductase